MDALVPSGGFPDGHVVKAGRFCTLALVSQSDRRSRRRHLSLWTEPLPDAARFDDERDDAVGTVTPELLSSLAVVRGVTRLLLQDPTLPAAERSTLLTVLDRQADLMQETLARIALDRGEGASAGPLTLDDVARN